MKKLLLLTSVILSLHSIQAQDYRFGKVSDDEIKQEKHHLDSEVSAAILYKRAKVSLQYNSGWEYVYDFEARIKIYNQSGYDFATVEVPLYRVGAGNNEILSNFRGFTHNMEDGKSSSERVRNRNMFDEDLNEFWDIKKITFPNVKEGSVLEYRYKITSPYTRSLPEFTFQDQIPVDFAEYTLNIPEYLGYKVISKGFFPLSRDSKTSLQDFKFTYVPRQNINNRTGIVKKATQQSTLRQTETQTTYTAKNVPKIVQEEYINNYKNYITSLKPELEWRKMPQSSLETFSTSWDDVVKDVYKLSSFGGELYTNNYFERELDAVLKNASTPVDKKRAVFEFVKKRMTWNGKYSFFTHKGVKDAYKDRTGNVGEINIMLTAMLRHAGLEANPVLVSTKSNGISLFPTRTGFNYVISAVEIDNQVTLLDATNPYSTPNVLPQRALNWLGRLVKEGEETKQIRLMPSVPSRSIVNMEVNINPNGSINGKFRNSLTDHIALSYRTKFQNQSENSYIDELEIKHNNIEIENYSTQNKTDAYKPLIESYSFVKENAYEIIGEKLYVSPMFFVASNRNPFTAETRTYPIDFSFPRSQAYMINILIPEGYNVESIPESGVFQLPDGLGEFHFMISSTENNIQLRVKSDINSSLVPADYYEPLKEYFAAMIDKQSEKIVLSKI